MLSLWVPLSVLVLALVQRSPLHLMALQTVLGLLRLRVAVVSCLGAVLPPSLLRNVLHV